MPIELLQKRKISGRGILRLSPEDKGFKYYRLYLDVVRRPKNEFINLNWNPHRGKYAFVSFMKQDRVLSRFALESLSEELQFIPDVAGQMQLMAKCMVDMQNESFINLGVRLGLPPIQNDNLIKEFLSLDIGWDEARIVCYADTAVELALYGQEYDVCAEPDKRQDPGGEPIPPPPPIPPGTPIEDISEPYDDESDDENSIPHPLDDLPEPPPPPPPVSGVRRILVTVSLSAAYGGGTQVHEKYADIPYHFEKDATNHTLYWYTYTESFPGSGVMLEAQTVLASGGQGGPSYYTGFTVNDALGYIAEIRPLR